MLEQWFFKINYLEDIVVGSRKYKTITIFNVDITVIPKMFIVIINNYVFLSFLLDYLFIYGLVNYELKALKQSFT